MPRPRVGTLFSYDWDALGYQAQRPRYACDRAGFDLFSFPSNARLVGFDLERFAERQAARGRRRGWAGVVSHHEQRRLHPVVRTNVHGSPANVDSPWMLA